MTCDLVKETTREFNLAFQDSRLGFKSGMGIGAIYPELNDVDVGSNVWFIPSRNTTVKDDEYENMSEESSMFNRSPNEYSAISF